MCKNIDVQGNIVFLIIYHSTLTGQSVKRDWTVRVFQKVHVIGHWKQTTSKQQGRPFEMAICRVPTRPDCRIPEATSFYRHLAEISVASSTWVIPRRGCSLRHDSVCGVVQGFGKVEKVVGCLLYTSDAADE